MPVFLGEDLGARGAATDLRFTFPFFAGLGAAFFETFLAARAGDLRLMERSCDGAMPPTVRGGCAQSIVPPAPKRRGRSVPVGTLVCALGVAEMSNAGPSVTVAVAPGDGIGPEIMDATLQLFDAAGVASKVAFRKVEMGASVFAKGNSRGMTDEAVRTSKSAASCSRARWKHPRAGAGSRST